MMKLRDRWYWFRKNTWNYFLFLLFFLPYGAWVTLWSLYDATKILTTTNGSAEIRPPWKWQWNLYNDED